MVMVCNFYHISIMECFRCQTWLSIPLCWIPLQLCWASDMSVFIHRHSSQLPYQPGSQLVCDWSFLLLITYKCACFVCLMHYWLLGNEEFECRRGLLGANETQTRQRWSRFDCSSNEKLTCFDGYRERLFLVLHIHNVKRRWKSELVFPDISQWHGDTFVQSVRPSRLKVFSQMAVQTHSRLSCLADVRILSHCHSRTALVFQLFAIWAVCVV